MTDTIVERIIRLKRLCTLQEDEIRGTFDLSPAEYHGLCSLLPGEHVICRELSQRMDLSVSRGSRVIEKLVAKGFLSVQSTHSDRRRQELTLTPKGVEFRRKIDARKRECEQQIISNLKPLHLSRIKQSLDLLCDILVNQGVTHESVEIQ